VENGLGDLGQTLAGIRGRKPRKTGGSESYQKLKRFLSDAGNDASVLYLFFNHARAATSRQTKGRL